MSASLLVVSLAAFVVLISCLILALHKDYHSGIFGTFFLGMVAFGAFGRLEGIMESHDRAIVTPVALFVWVGMAGFFAHLVKKFVCRLHKRGKGDWYESDGIGRLL